MSILLILLTAGASAGALTHSIAIGEAPQGCVEAEIARRTLSVNTSRMSCSAVALNANVVRFAGHCFRAAPSLGGVYDAAGKYLAEDGAIRREGGYQISTSFDLPDQAEVTWDRALVEVGPIELADVDALPENNRVVVAGFGFARFRGPVWKHPFPESGLRYAWGHVDRIASRVPNHRGRFGWRFTPDNPRASAATGDEGGPAFLVEGCRLKFIGVMVGRKISAFGGVRTTWIRPHTDLR